MRVLAGLVPVAFGLLLSACAAAPERGVDAAPAVAQGKRCDGREATGSRLARCDRSDVRVISGEEIRATGVPSSGGGGPAN